MTAVAAGLIPERLGAFLLPCPDGWEIREAGQRMLAVEHPRVPDGVFRPNMVLRWERANGASVARYATAALASALQQLRDPRIISHELWRPNGGRAVAEGPGRRQRFVHRVGPHPVCVDRWIWETDGWMVEGSCSYTVGQHPGMKLLFEQMIQDQRIDAALLGRPEKGETEGAAEAVGGVSRGLASGDLASIAPREPRLDDAASAWAGTAVEDLGAVAGEQPCRNTGRIMSIPSLELLDTLMHRDRLGRFQRKNPAAVQLQAAGLLTGEGTLTAAGEEFLLPVRQSDASFLLEARRAEGGSVLQAWIGGGWGKVTETGPDPDDLAVQLVPAGMVPGLIAGWAGLAPAWSIPHEPLVLTMDHYEARIGAGCTCPPKDPGSEVLRMWEQPWTEWQIVNQETGGWFGWVNAARAGHYRLSPGPGGSVRLEPMSSAVVWDVLVRFIHASVEGIPLLLPEVPGFNG